MAVPLVGPGKSSEPQSSEPAFIAWSEIFALGHKGLDAEHRRIVDAINEIHIAVSANQTPISMLPSLEALKLLLVEHFRNEESVMCEILDDKHTISKPKKPGFFAALSKAMVSEHIAEHAEKLSELGSIIDAHLSETDPTKSTLDNDLRGWFFNHAIKYDADLKAVFQAM